MTEAAAVQPSFEIRRVAVIGAGVAGRSFALACAGAGFHVVLEDVMPANLRQGGGGLRRPDSARNGRASGAGVDGGRCRPRGRCCGGLRAG